MTGIEIALICECGNRSRAPMIEVDDLLFVGAQSYHPRCAECERRMRPLAASPESTEYITEHGEDEHGSTVEVHLPVMTYRDYLVAQGLPTLLTQSYRQIERGDMTEDELVSGIEMLFDTADAVVAMRKKRDGV